MNSLVTELRSYRAVTLQVLVPASERSVRRGIRLAWGLLVLNILTYHRWENADRRTSGFRQIRKPAERGLNYEQDLGIHGL
jgi:hypothetical protein